jgi:chromosome segregation ATPase
VIIARAGSPLTTLLPCARRAENEALRQTLLACQEKLRVTEQRASKAAETIEAETSAREAVEATLLSLERVREQGEQVVKVEMDMRKDLGRDLVTAMETVGQLEKQLGEANKRLREVRPPIRSSVPGAHAVILSHCLGEDRRERGRRP